MSNLVVIIDDDPNIRKIFTAIVKRTGFEVVSVETAEAAIELSKTRQVGVYVVDRQLPGMNGEEFIAQHPLGTAVAFMATASVVDQDLMAAMMTKGMVFVIQKPVSPVMLTAAVLKAMALHNILESNEKQKHALEEAQRMSDEVSAMLEDAVDDIRDSIKPRNHPAS